MRDLFNDNGYDDWRMHHWTDDSYDDRLDDLELEYEEALELFVLFKAPDPATEDLRSEHLDILREKYTEILMESGETYEDSYSITNDVIYDIEQDVLHNLNMDI